MIILAICLIASMSLNLYIFEISRRREKDLLDRLMAKDFVEYRLNTETTKPRPKHFHMDDEREARIEASRKKVLSDMEQAALKANAIKV